MSVHRSRSRPRLSIPHRKHHVDFESPSHLGSLSPDLQPSSPPTFADGTSHAATKVGKYLLTHLTVSNNESKLFKAIHYETQEEYVCKVFPLDKYREILSAYWQVGASNEHINAIQEILLGETQAYVFFLPNYGDLHSYIRLQRKLKEDEARHFFSQICSAVHHCHANGVVLRDIKLRKFVFKDAERSELMLEGLEDACVLEDDTDDRLADKHGCPAYVSPEILRTSQFYSGKSADVWGLGVMFYTMLIGRYPFHDTEPSVLFSKIRRGQFSIPESTSSRAKCLIRSLLRLEPERRLTTPEILAHPWFHSNRPVFMYISTETKDQTVPDIAFQGDDEAAFFS